jgi:beta-ribofuranosylaminobenzene 5'-phosphate synthase
MSGERNAGPCARCSGVNQGTKLANSKWRSTNDLKRSGATFNTMTSYSSVHVNVEAPARLHLGFLDLNGSLGRRFGSLGVAIDTLSTRLQAERTEAFSAHGPGAERALALAKAFAEARGLKGGACLTIDQIIPEHAGLGSGTQLALAVGTAIEQLYAAESGSRAIAQTLNRGGRSGIGIAAFDEGGFIVDCGRGNHSDVPLVAMRLPFPARWRLVLIMDSRAQGLHGLQEAEAFARLPEFPEAAAGRLCRLLMMKIVPGLLEQRLEPVAEGIGEMQRVVGDHFAPAQRGRFASPAVAEVLTWLEHRGLAGTGQSSWGPTGFVLVEDDAAARTLERELKKRFGVLSPLRYLIVGARNRGASVSVARAPLQVRRES